MSLWVYGVERKKKYKEKKRKKKQSVGTLR